MAATIAVVEVVHRSRWARQNINRKLAGLTMLEWVVRRLKDCQQLDAVVVQLPAAGQVQVIADQIPADVPTICTMGADPLSRFSKVLERYRPKSVVRVSSDNPFLDPSLVDRLVTTAEKHPNCDYISYCSQSGRRAVLTSLGLVAEWCSADALQQADYEAVEAEDREDITSYVRRHPEKFALRMIPLPATIDKEDFRFTITQGEDWDRAHAIYEVLGPDRLDWQRIANLFELQSDLRQEMAQLNQVDGIV